MEKNTSGNHLTEGSILKSIIVLAIPIVIANLLQTAYNITDTFWVGRLGANAVAAVSLTFPVIFLIITFSNGVGLAGAILVSQYKGAKDKQKVNHISAQTFLVALSLSLIGSAIGFILTPTIINLLGAESSVIPDAISYMRYSFLGLFFVFGFITYQSLSNGEGDPKTPLYIVLITVVLNIFLDPLFIFGYKFIPALGVAGAAMATLSTQGLALFIGLFVFIKCKKGICLKFSDFKPDLPVIKRLVKLGIPTSLEQSSRSIGFIILTAISASFGTVILASYGIGMRIMSLVIIPALSLSIVNSTLVGQNIGAKKPHRARKVVNISLAFGFILLTLIGILFFIFAKQISTVFIPGDPDVISSSTMFLKIIALPFGLIAIMMTLFGAFRGSGNPKITMIIAWIGMITQVTIALSLSKLTSLNELGIWASLPISNLVGTLIAITVFLRGNWIKTRIISH